MSRVSNYVANLWLKILHLADGITFAGLHGVSSTPFLVEILVHNCKFMCLVVDAGFDLDVSSVLLFYNQELESSLVSYTF